MGADTTTATDGGGVATRLSRYLPGGDESGRLPYLMVVPAVAWYVLFLLLPLAVIVVYSFLTYVSYSVEFTFTLDAWRSTVFTGQTLSVFVRTIGIGVGVTLLTLAFGYPLAYYLRFYASQNGGLILLLFLIIPFWTSGLIRTTGWIPLLGRTGVVNTTLLWVGVINEPLSWLLFSPFSQIIGYLQSYLVFMAAPIFISLAQIDDNLLDASATLRGGPFTTFHKVTWPLSLPGVAIGSIFVFVLSIGDFVIPQFLSGGQATISTLVYFLINSGLNYPASSALSLALLAVILACVFLMIRVVDISEIIR